MTDELLFDFSELYKYGRALPETKRSVLKLTAKIFDPIGFLTPFTFEMKIMFQELCLEKVDWDSELEGNLFKSWTLLLEELRCLSSVRIPRCYFQSTPVKCELHGFCDASHRVYEIEVSCISNILPSVLLCRTLQPNGKFSGNLWFQQRQRKNRTP